MHFRVGGGISWKEQADVILASLSVGAVMFMLVAVMLQIGVIVNSHESCLTKLELDNDLNEKGAQTLGRLPSI